MFTKYEALRSSSVHFTLSTFAATLLLACALFASAGAQNIRHTANSIDQTMRGGMNVDPSTLNMSFSVTLGDYPGRGASLPVTMNYASKVWRLRHTGTIIGLLDTYTHTKPMFGEHSVSGWTVSLDEPYFEYTPDSYDASGNPYCLDCGSSDPVYWVERVILHLPGGATHELRRASDAPVQRAAGAGAPALSGVYVAVDGSRLKFDYLNATEQVIYMPDGSRYRLLTTGAEFIDRNGNKLAYNKTTKQWTDTLGRTIGFVLSNSSAQTQNLGLPAVGGQAMNFQLVWKNLSQALSPGAGSLRYRGSLICQPPYNGLSPALFTSPSSLERVCGDSSSPTQGVLFDPVVLNEIILPNGRKYIFTYNVYGEIDKIVLPMGGYQRYVHAQIEPLDSDQQGDLYRQTNRGVTSHYVSATGQAVDEKQWTYAISTAGGKYTVSVTGPNGAKAERDLLRSTGSTGFSYDDARAGRANEERTYTASSQMWRRTLTEWDKTTQQLPPPLQLYSATRDPRPIKQVEILLDTSGDALATTTTMGYDADLNQTVTNKYAYATVNQTTAQAGAITVMPLGTLLRTEDSTFLVNDTAIAQATRDAYRARHLISLPSSTRVKQGNTVVAETQFKYDETAYPVLTYGVTPSGWTNPPGVRGNVTTIRRWLNMSGATVQSYPSGSYLETHAQYDQCGSVRKSWDAKGALSQVSYTDNFSDSVNRNTFAYATSSTTPVPDSSGYYGSSASFTSSTVYEFNTGKIVTTTDANNKTTSYFYTDDGGALDSLQRLRRVTLPDGLGETKYVFGDTPGDLYIRTLTKQNATTWLEDRTNFDGLGRATRSGHYEAANSWSVKDTEYDTLGRVKRVTNPYFAANLSGATPGNAEWTTNTYDDLNRVLTVTAPDGSKVETTYSGAQVTVKDPANKKRRSVTDALGRLTQVVEDPDGAAFQTSYTFDTLGNLTIVNQGGQYRYFFYDSLGRLARAKNPEQSANGSLNLTNPPAYNNNWSLGYVYDSNGNLLTRTDARGVTANYGYDALNRNVSASYTDGVTPALERHYDGAISGGKGWFHYNFNYTANPATGGAGYSRLVVSGYDALGRVTSQSQGFLANDGVTWKDYPVSRTYDLASNVLTQNYPSTRSVTYGYGASGRLATASGNLGGSSFTYSDTITYNAAGQMLKERFGTQNAAVPPGSGYGLYHNLRYNKRLQLAEVFLGSVNDDSNWDRGKLQFYYGLIGAANQNPFLDDTSNNGNLVRQWSYVPLPGGGYVTPQLDDYAYDGLNRITSIAEAQMNSSGQWTFNVTSQTFTYDCWGNRLSVAGYNAQNWDATEASLTNRLKLPSGTSCSGTKNGLCYDAAGNLIFDNQLGSTGDRAYDAEGRMTSAAGGGLNKYVYDADGKRVRRQVSAQQFWQVYGIGGELVAEYLWDGTTATLQKEYGYRDGDMLIVAEGATVRWLVKDHLGTPRMIADQNGSLSGMRRHDYLPFGEENFAGPAIRTAANGYQAEGIRQKFTGYERDAETSLDYAQARYYANLQGRFTSVDPLHSSAYALGPQSWNRYAYVGNRPTIITDPSGLKWFYNKKTNRYGWCDCNVLNQEQIDEGWGEIAGASGDILYPAANGSLILLPWNSSRWRDLTAEVMREMRLRQISLAKERAEQLSNALILEFYSISIGYGVSLATGGVASVAKEFVIDQAFDYAGQYFGGAGDVEQAAVAPYQVGLYSQLKDLEESYDGLSIHHVPQGHPASQVIPGYDYNNAPAIALPSDEHDNIKNRRGKYTGTAQELIKQDINNLRKHTNTPESAIKQLQRLIRKVY
ncbi:MAG: RHS repeat domain-containing protein [Blastocatellales bacterium]